MASAYPVVDAARGDDLTFGGLILPGETHIDALKRIQKSPTGVAALATPDGQRLLEAINQDVKAARAGRGRPITRLPDAEAEVASLNARGMDLEAHELAEALASGTQFLEIPVADLIMGPNVRVDPGELDELASNIAQHGVLQPIRVRPEGAGWVVLVGQRRTLAAKMIGLERIPAVIDRAAKTPAIVSIEQLSENLLRKDMNPIEEAVALRAVLDAEAGLTQEALADKLGRSRPWVSNTLRLLGLVEPVQQALRAGTISQSHGRAIAALPAKQQEELTRRVVDSKMSSTDLEREIKWKTDAAQQEERKAAATVRWIPKAIAALEAAKVPKDAPVYVTGSVYNLDVEAVRQAVKQAGWGKAGGEYFPSRAVAASCDCTAVILEVGGRKAAAKPGCNDSRHGDRARNIDHLAERAREQAIGAKVADLIARIRPLLEAVPLPLLLLIAVRSHVELPELIAGKGDPDRAQLRDLAAGELAGRANSRYVFGDRRAADDQALDDILAMLDPVVVPEPEPAAHSILRRGICSVCGRDVALRKGGVAREHGRYDEPDQPGVLLERVCSGAGKAAAAS